MAKTDPRTEMTSRRAPQWAWDTVDETLQAAIVSYGNDADTVREVENAIDVLRPVIAYSYAHMENAVMLMEHMTQQIISEHPVQGTWLADIGGSAELRAHVIAIAKELEDQFLAIGLKWDEDCGFYDLTERIATAITMHPKTEPAQLVRDVLNAELKVVFRP